MNRSVVLVLLSAVAFSLSAQKTDGLHCAAALLGSANFRTCELPAEAIGRLSLASVDSLGRPIGTIARLDSILRTTNRRLIFAMNAGIYERAGVTTGLLVVDSEAKTPLDTSRGPIGGCERSNFHCPPNGVFFVTRAGTAHVWTTAQFAHKYGAGRVVTGVRLATQSGPLLLRDGRLARAFNPKSQSRLIRNGVCVRADGSILFVLADNVTHFDFATTLRDRYRCRDALFLDGNVSQMYTGTGHPPPGEAFGALLFVAANLRVRG